MWERAKPIFYEWSGNRIIRKGKWKLISLYAHNKWELYDMDTDRSENNDVAKDNPSIVADMNAAYLSWAKQNDVTDWNEELASKTGSAFKKN